jgi:hypothetical protein
MTIARQWMVWTASVVAMAGLLPARRAAAAHARLLHTRCARLRRAGCARARSSAQRDSSAVARSVRWATDARSACAAVATETRSVPAPASAPAADCMAELEALDAAKRRLDEVKDVLQTAAAWDR